MSDAKSTRRLVPRASILARACLLTLTCSTARAVEPSLEPALDTRTAPGSGYFLHVGPGALVLDAKATIHAAGAALPGATVKIDPNTTLITEFGYRWNNNVAISLTGGVPPWATVNGAGSVDGVGELGRIRYAPIVLAAQYRFTQFGPERSYRSSIEKPGSSRSTL